MITRLFCACVALLAIASSMHAQKVVVSEIKNDNNQAGEWTELLVVQDDISLVGHHLTDWNGFQLVRQGGVTFRNAAIWQHLRAGTIIVIHHDVVPGGTQPDTNAADGYLELSRLDGRYFDQYGNSGLNLNQDGDIVVLHTPDTGHVHALGYADPAGPGFSNAPPPKVMADTAAVGSDRSIAVIGRTLAAYDARISNDSTAVSPGGSRGFPNLMDAVRSLQGRPNVNQRFWRETREPQWSAAPSITLISQTAQAHTIEWTPLVDTYPQDGTTGVVILRDSLDFTSFPADGIRDGAIYTAGTRIGSALILAIRPNSAGNRYNDSLNLLCGQNYSYRVYGYRYDADQRLTLAQTVDTTARGRQYTELRFAQSSPVTKANPAKPVIATSKTQMCPGDTATLTTTSAGPRYEWTINGQPVAVGGTTRLVVFEVGTYRLRVVADGGCFAESDPITISSLPAASIDVSPTGTQSMCAGDSIVLRALSPFSTYQWLRNGQVMAGETSATLVARQDGDYFVRSVSSQGCPATSAVVRIRIPNVTYSFSAPTLDFGTLGSCASSALRTIDVINSGVVPITISNVTFTSGFSLVSPAPGFSLAPGDRRTLTVLFSPSVTGTTNGVATLTAQPCDVQQTFGLVGVRTQALASINKAAVDFGIFTACDLQPDIRPDSVFVITNDGASDITVVAPIVRPPFFLDNAPVSVTLTPGTTQSYRIFYRPNGPERNRSVIDDILFPYSSQTCSDTLRATLKAAAYRPVLAFDIGTIDVGALLSCQTVVDTFITVTNNALVDAVLEGSSNPAIVLPDVPLTFTPGISRSVRVVFNVPAAPGAFTASTNLRVLTCGDVTPLTISGSVVPITPSFAQQVFDFGVINSCDTLRTRTQTMRLYLRGAQGSITSVDLASPFASTLTPGTTFTDSTDVLLTFAPTSLGTFTDTLRVVMGPCGDTVKLVLFGTSADPSATITMTATDFGTLIPGQTVTERLVVRNTGTVPLAVQPVENIAPPFSVISSTPALPATLMPNDSAVVLIQYIHVGPGREDIQSINIRTTGVCPSNTTFGLIGRTQGSGAITGVILAMPANVIAIPGEEIDIPISLNADVPLDPANATSMHIVVSYDGTLARALRASDATTLGITATVVETSPGRATIDLTSVQPLRAAQPLINLRVKTYLGRTTQSVLHVDSVSAKGLEITGQDGLLTIVGSCDADARQIVVSAPVGLVARATNADEILIEFTTLTDDPVDIRLVDMQGAVRSTVLSGQLRPATYQLHQPAADLQSGVYLVVLRHGLHTRTVKLLLSP